MCFGRNLSDSKILCGGLLQQRLRSLTFSPRSDPLQLILTRNSLQSKTEYRCIVPISQIFYSQYHKWDILGFRLKSKVFVEKQQLNDGQGTHSAKKGTDTLFGQSAQLAQLFGMSAIHTVSQLLDFINSSLHTGEKF